MGSWSRKAVRLAVREGGGKPRSGAVEDVENLAIISVRALKP